MNPQRARALRALGLTSWRLRGQTAAAATAPLAVAVAFASPPDARTARLLMQALQALDPTLAAAAEAAFDTVAARMPAAQNYLVFGTAPAQRLAAGGAHLVQLGEPAALFEAAGKRQLWQAWRALRRRQREG